MLLQVGTLIMTHSVTVRGEFLRNTTDTKKLTRVETKRGTK